MIEDSKQSREAIEQEFRGGGGSTPNLLRGSIPSHMSNQARSRGGSRRLIEPVAVGLADYVVNLPESESILTGSFLDGSTDMKQELLDKFMDFWRLPAWKHTQETREFLNNLRGQPSEYVAKFTGEVEKQAERILAISMKTREYA